MRDKKLQVFVSSTFTDLKTERQAAVEAILSSGNIPAGMELFSAGDESQMTVIKRWIDESDVYLLILGGRYGSIEPKSGKSYTHLEYEYANEIRKPLFTVVVSKMGIEFKIKSGGIDFIEQQNPQKYKEFKETVEQNLVRFWDDTKDIKLAIHETLSEFTYRKDLLGWIRGDNQINTAILAEEIARLTKENSDLHNQLQDRQSEMHITYAGLSYVQLKNMLLNEMTVSKSPENVKTLFDFLMETGTELSKGTYGNKEHENFEKLELYKIVEKRFYKGEKSIFGHHLFHFTNDGQNFYLKSLSQLLQTRKED